MIDNLVYSAYGTLEILKYVLMLLMIFRLPRKIKKIKMAILVPSAYPYLVIVNHFVERKYSIFAILIAAIAISIIAFEETYIKIIVLLFFSTFVLSICDIFGFYLFDKFGLLHGVDSNFTNIFGLIVVMIAGEFLEKKEAIDLDVKQYIVWGIGAFGCFLTIIIVTFLNKGKISERTLNIWMIFEWMAFLSNVFMMNYYFFIMRKNKCVEEENKQYKDFVKLQKKEIEEKIVSDKKLRRVRHDMRAHLIAIEQLACENQSEELLEYISRLKSETAVFQNKSYTGNIAVDAVIRDCVDNARERNVIIDWDGRIPYLPMDTFDFCVLISNLLNNAAEACGRVQHSEKKMDVELKEFGNKILLRVRNPIEWDLKIYDGELITTKLDKENHGIGIKNVNRIIRKYQGTVEYISEGGKFSVEIFI